MQGRVSMLLALNQLRPLALFSTRSMHFPRSSVPQGASQDSGVNNQPTPNLNRGKEREAQPPWRGRRMSSRGRGDVMPALHGSERNTGYNSGKDRPTHFLAIPLGHIADLRMAASTFTSALLAQLPPVQGLDESIIIPARRLHLTLGVMNLVEGSNINPLDNARKTVSASLALLQSLRSRILDVLGGAALRVPLTCIDVMKPTRASFGMAHVMFVGPAEDGTNSEDAQKLKRVCELVKAEFILAGLTVDDRRPLKLHCTLLNTIHRKPRSTNGQRIPFSFADVLASNAFNTISMEPTTSSTTISRMHNRVEIPFVGAKAGQSSNVAVKEYSLEDADEVNNLDFTKMSLGNPSNRPAELGKNSWARDATPQGQRVDLGTYAVSEIQICKMGSWGAEGEYVCVGKICF